MKNLFVLSVSLELIKPYSHMNPYSLYPLIGTSPINGLRLRNSSPDRSIHPALQLFIPIQSIKGHFKALSYHRHDSTFGIELISRRHFNLHHPLRPQIPHHTLPPATFSIVFFLAESTVWTLYPYRVHLLRMRMSRRRRGRKRIRHAASANRRV